MEMILMSGCVTLFTLAVACLAFGAATRQEREQPPATPQPKVQPSVRPATPRFFAPNVSVRVSTRPQVPIEALLLQIENHVRLEQAAAESFLEYPTTALLHSKTASPLIQ